MTCRTLSSRWVTVDAELVVERRAGARAPSWLGLLRNLTLRRVVRLVRVRPGGWLRRSGLSGPGLQCKLETSGCMNVRARWRAYYGDAHIFSSPPTRLYCAYILAMAYFSLYIELSRSSSYSSPFSCRLSRSPRWYDSFRHAVPTFLHRHSSLHVASVHFLTVPAAQVSCEYMSPCAQLTIL